MSYLDLLKGQTQPSAAGVEPENRYGTTVDEGDTGGVLSVLSDKSPELPVLDAGPGSPSLRHRVLQLGEAHGYPALSLGRYRFRRRTTSVGLSSGKWWWTHLTNYFGDTLLDEVVERLAEREQLIGRLIS